MYSDVEILLVEDNADDAELAIRSFKKNYPLKRLLHVEDGAEALDFFYSKGKFTGKDPGALPKVILLDLKLPKINGLDVLKTLKSDPVFSMIPVTILTSSTEHIDIEKAYKLGVNSYIVKPVEFDEFSKLVSQIGLYWLFINQPPLIQ